MPSFIVITLILLLLRLLQAKQKRRDVPCPNYEEHAAKDEQPRQLAQRPFHFDWQDEGRAFICLHLVVVLVVVERWCAAMRDCDFVL